MVLRRLAGNATGYLPVAERSVAARHLNAIGAHFGLAALDGSAYVYERAGNGSAVVRYDAALHETGRLGVDELGTMTGQGGWLWMGNRSVAALGADLRVQGNVSLSGTGSIWKMGDDIVLHEGIAYVLDDVVSPLFAFRIEASDPAALRVAGKVHLTGNHLPAQWLDPVRGQWLMTSSSGGMGFAGETLHVVDMTTATIAASFASYTYRDMRYQVPNGTDNFTGFRILTAAGPSPAWALLSGRASHHLARISLDRDGTSLQACLYALPLPFAPTRENPATYVAELERRGSNVVGKFGDVGFVLEDSHAPRLLFAGAMKDLAALRFA